MNTRCILIAGGTGLLGQTISDLLQQQGYLVRVLTRAYKKNFPYEQFIWNPTTNHLDLNALKNVYGVIQLSGESIAGARWTKVYKKKLYDSRVLSTRFLIDQINKCETKPSVFISISAVGIYGDRPHEILDENSIINQKGTLIDLCKDWESEVSHLHSDIRSAIIRTGLVLSIKDGILAKSLLPALFGIAPVFGNGRQEYPWIHIHDLARIFQFVIDNNKCQGVFNATAPNPVSQKEFALAIPKTMNRFKIPVPVPKWALKWIVGELADELYISQYILPRRLMDSGFTFTYPVLETALKALLSKRK